MNLELVFLGEGPRGQKLVFLPGSNTQAQRRLQVTMQPFEEMSATEEEMNGAQEGSEAEEANLIPSPKAKQKKRPAKQETSREANEDGIFVSAVQRKRKDAGGHASKKQATQQAATSLFALSSSGVEEGGTANLNSTSTLAPSSPEEKQQSQSLSVLKELPPAACTASNPAETDGSEAETEETTGSKCRSEMARQFGQEMQKLAMDLFEKQMEEREKEARLATARAEKERKRAEKEKEKERRKEEEKRREEKLEKEKEEEAKRRRKEEGEKEKKRERYVSSVVKILDWMEDQVSEEESTKEMVVVYKDKSKESTLTKEEEEEIKAVIRDLPELNTTFHKQKIRSGKVLGLVAKGDLSKQFCVNAKLGTTAQEEFVCTMKLTYKESFKSSLLFPCQAFSKFDEELERNWGGSRNNISSPLQIASCFPTEDDNVSIPNWSASDEGIDNLNKSLIALFDKFSKQGTERKVKEGISFHIRPFQLSSFLDCIRTHSTQPFKEPSTCLLFGPDPSSVDCNTKFHLTDESYLLSNPSLEGKGGDVDMTLYTCITFSDLPPFSSFSLTQREMHSCLPLVTFKAAKHVSSSL